MSAFDTVMRRMPHMLTGLAVVYYLATVFVSLAMGDELTQNFGDAVPTTYRIKALLIIFVQPLTSAAILLFGAALLWRIDQFRIGQAKDNAQ